MKFSQLFVVFALFCVAQVLEAGGGSEECQKRRDTCGELVRPHESCESDESDESGEGGPKPQTTRKPQPVTTTKQSTQPTLAQTTKAASTVSYGTTVNGICVCDDASTAQPTEGSGVSEGVSEGVSSGVTEGVSSGVTEGVSSGVSDGVSDGVTGRVSSKTTVGGIKTTKKPHRPTCPFTEAMWNISITLKEEWRVILQKWIIEVETTILIDYKFYTEDELVVLIGYALKNFSLTYTEIWIEISYEKVVSWGYCIDFIYCAYQIQLEITAEIVIIDINGDCELFEAIRNATQGHPDLEDDVKDLIAELLAIFKGKWSYSQKLAACHKVFKYYFELNFELSVVLKGCSIGKYGSFESFLDVCLIYERITTISVVVGGSNSECVILKELKNVYTNTSVELSVRNQIKQLHDKCAAYFETTTSVTLRMKYVSQQCYSFFQLVSFNVKIVNTIKLTFWGSIHDFLFCSHICTNCGCDNPDDGPGKDDSTTVGLITEAPTTEAVTTEAVTTEAVTTEAVTTKAPTTEAPTTTSTTTTKAPSTPKPADCSNKNIVVALNSNNSSYLITHLEEHYATWNASIKTGFNSYFNQIKSYSYDLTITIEQRVSKCQTSLRNYNKNNVEKQKIVWSISITEWVGTIGDFCNCA